MEQQVCEQTPYRDYFPLCKWIRTGWKNIKIDSMIVKWRMEKQVLLNVEANQKLSVAHANAKKHITGKSQTQSCMVSTNQ
jgi:hypothetical protein